MLVRSAADTTPEVVWLLGHPVRHSLSPAMHNAAFRHAGLDITYVARDVEPKDLAEAVAGLRSPRMKGANVTVPHKQAVLPLLDEIEPSAFTIGAVNTIVNEGGRLVGHNTDVGGFLRAVMTVLPKGVAGLGCLVLGAGGAARAVVAALQQEGAATVWVANRTRSRADSLCGAGREWGTGTCIPLDLQDVASVTEKCALIVNTTSIGLEGSVKELPLAVDTLHSGQVLVDLVYSAGPEPTRLVQAARGGKLAAIDGKEMLLQQAALSFRLWTGLDAPLDVMRRTVDDS